MKHTQTYIHTETQIQTHTHTTQAFPGNSKPVFMTFTFYVFIKTTT